MGNNNVAEAGKSGEIARLTFTRNADESVKEKPENGQESFTVMINPESISRKMSISATDNKASKSKSKGDVHSCSPEVISFSFYLDRTNVVPQGIAQNANKSVDDMINDFLRVVYKAPNGNPVKSLSIKYGEQFWTVRTNDISIEHSLFSRKGTTLRAKISCSFSTIADDTNEKKKPPTKTPKPKPQACECVCTCPASVDNARSNNQNSLYTPADANFSTDDGREIKI